MRVFSILAGAGLSFALLAAPAPRRAPGFSLPDSNNGQQDLADYRGKFVIVELMRTNCPHCVPFSRILEQVKTRYGGKVVVLSIAPAPDNPTTVAKFVVENKLTYPILYDCGQVAYSYVRTAAIEVPHIYIVGPDGMIVKDFVFGPETESLFSGRGLFDELDRMVSKGPARKR